MGALQAPVCMGNQQLVMEVWPWFPIHPLLPRSSNQKPGVVSVPPSPSAPRSDPPPT